MSNPESDPGDKQTFQDNLQKFKTQRNIIKSQLERFNTFFSTYEESKRDTLDERRSKCEALWGSFVQVQDYIDHVEPSEENFQYRASFEDMYFDVMGCFKRLLPAKVEHGQTTGYHQPHIVEEKSVNLPPINLPKFDGSYDKWLTFHDTFCALIHSNHKISKVQKFYYLQASLIGDAAQVVHSLEVCEANYEIAWNLLQKRFENKRLIIHSHMKSLFNLSPINKDSHTGLRQLVDNVQRDIRALKALKEPVDTWDTMLIYLICSKLDVNTKKEWETYSIKENRNEFTDFIDFLTNRCNLLETLESDKVTTSKAQYDSNVRTQKHSYSSHAQKSHTTHTFSATSKNSCVLCNDIHPLYSCVKFLNLSPQEKLNEVRRLRLCKNCLKIRQVDHNCQAGSCKKCGRFHNTLLHIESYNHTNNSFSHKTNNSHSNSQQTFTQSASNGNTSNNTWRHQAPASTENNRSDEIHRTQHNNNNCLTSTSEQNTNHSVISTHASNIIPNNEILLSTVKLLIFDSQGNSHEIRALLDVGSQSNFLTKTLCQRLNLHTDTVKMAVVGINVATTQASQCTQATIKSKYNKQFTATLPFLIIERITNYLPNVYIDNRNLEIPSNVYLADPTFNVPGPVDMLLGAGIFYDLLCIGQIRLSKSAPVLQKTVFGWLVSGSVPRSCSTVVKNTTVCNFIKNSDIQDQLEKFWMLEEIQKKEKYTTQEEQECEELYQETTERTEDGRFIVTLPVKENINKLENTQEIATKRFYALERKLARNDEVRKQYTEFMDEYKKLGHMTEIPQEDVRTNNKTYYLPHHPVVTPTKITTKLRVVYDGSTKGSSGLSLNDTLKTGPIIQDELYDILIRFRRHTFVIGADIEKMFRQVWIQESQRDLQRIIWRSSTDQPLIHFRLNTITYGMTCASYLAIRSIQQAAREKQASYPEASNIIMKNFYVDDLLFGAEDAETAKRLRKEISIILAEAGFILRKWTSNSEEIIKPAEQAKTTDISHYIMDKEMTKTLGLVWTPREDVLQYTVKEEFGNKVTKRNILSTTAQIYDPLGLIAPITIKAKMLLQRLWQEKLDWDESVTQELYTAWQDFQQRLSMLNQLKVPRHAFSKNAVRVQLHGFCDSSEKAYGACIYVRCLDPKGVITVSLLCAKSRVAPMKTITLPRLELCGAILLAKLMRKTKEALEGDIEEIFFWTDSSIVLSWIAAEPSLWKVFVAHRVSEIQSLTHKYQWRHVRSNDNPADMVSRGCHPEEILTSKLWWRGPTWLSQPSSEWPTEQFMRSDPPERRNMTKVCLVTQSVFDQSIFLRYSTLLKLQRVVTYCFRFVKNCRSHKNEKFNNQLTVQELNNSLNCLIKVAQSQEFFIEIKAIQTFKHLHHSSKLHSLNPFIDSEGILRVGGRLQKSQVTYDQKFPILLSKGHPLTKLIIMHEHKKQLHAGPQSLLASLRLRYWIVNGRSVVRKILHNCVICFKNRPRLNLPIMGQLPEQRVTPAPPFYNSGVDYAGPMNVKASKLYNRKIIKAYLCIFVCFSTRAVHIEVASDLSTSAFLNAFKRFIARRGVCNHLFSDNGSNFVGASQELKDLKRLIDSEAHNSEINTFLTNQSITWHFIPPRSPHFGGIWEAAVKSAKYHMRRIIGNVNLTYEELCTVTAQVEACMNSRPLSPLPGTPNDPNPLTPGHFLVGRPLTALPERNIEDIPVNRLNRYQLTSQLVQHFWSRWSKEYLTTLNQRAKWTSSSFSKPLNVNDVVLLVEDNLPPMKWLLGRIVELHPGSDGVVRVVTLKCKDKLLRRAVVKIAPLPMDTN